jgi:hypothetical protein
MSTELERALLEQALYIVRVDDRGEHADMGIELAERDDVRAWFPELCVAVEAAPYDSDLRAELGYALAAAVLRRAGA